MAWADKTRNGMGTKQEVVTLPASSYGYSSAIDFLKVNGKGNARYATLFAEASAVSGTNVDISLWGAYTSGGTKFLLTDAPGSIVDLTNAAKAQGASFNVEAYPAPYYFIGMLVDASEVANTVTLNLTKLD